MTVAIHGDIERLGMDKIESAVMDVSYEKRDRLYYRDTSLRKSYHYKMEEFI